MPVRLNSAQKILLNQWKGEKVTIEMVNKTVHENVKIIDIDPYHMVFIIDLGDRERTVQIKHIFHIDKMKEPGEIETRTKTYDGILSN